MHVSVWMILSFAHIVKNECKIFLRKNGDMFFRAQSSWRSNQTFKHFGAVEITCK
jgi:hypothetical protein